MAVRKKDHLLSVAQRMFCTRGFHAVSVDAILEEAGVARMTLYKNFGSKEDLIVATLRREDKLFRQWLASFVEARSTRPADRIESLFEGLHERFSSEGYYGCAFIRASVEFPDPTHPVHQVAREHKEMIRSYIRDFYPRAMRKLRRRCPSGFIFCSRVPLLLRSCLGSPGRQNTPG